MGASYLSWDHLTEEEIEARTVDLISRALNTRRMVGVVGSGVSVNYGYPLWRTMAAGVISKTLRRGVAPEDVKEYLKLARKTFKTVKSPAAAEQIMGALDLCERYWSDGADSGAVRTDFEGAVRQLVKPKVRRSDIDPLKQVVEELNLTRFLTTNYDSELENRLIGSGLAASPDEVRLTIDDADKLLDFAVGLRSPGVFHLHGTAAGKMTITERDYQKLYLRRDREAGAYREALGLVFSGNPILFLGIGLTELDLLHPLREAASQPRHDAEQSSLFALMPRPKVLTEAYGERMQIYARYGLRVLFYPRLSATVQRERSEQGRDIGKEFCEALRQLAQDHDSWWEGWRRKPPPRRPPYETDSGDEALGLYNSARGPQMFGQKQAIDRLVEKLPEGEGALVVALGRMGAGKGGVGNQLARTPNERYYSRFFATLHFTNDFLSIIAAAADHLGRSDDENWASNSPLERLETALMIRENLLVIGAVERCLDPINAWDEPTDGQDGAPGDSDQLERPGEPTDAEDRAPGDSDRLNRSSESTGDEIEKATWGLVRRYPQGLQRPGTWRRFSRPPRQLPRTARATSF